MKREELLKLLESRNPDKILDLTEEEFENIDFTDMDLRNIKFDNVTFTNCIFDGADLSYSSLENAWMPNTSLRGTKFNHANIKSVNFRDCDLTNADISDANLHAAVLENAIMDGIMSNEGTKYFRLRCPEEGAFIGYKKCYNDRLVVLYIPEDAERTSATMDSCRTNKAFVVAAMSFDGKERFKDANALVNQNFVYRVGEWVEVDDFNSDRWRDSTTGIHYWMTIEEALAY